MHEDQSSAKIVVVSALKAESQTLSQQANILDLNISGMGGNAVRECLTKLTPKNIIGLISWGVCGALKPALKSGDLLLPKTVMNQHGQAFECDENWRNAIQSTLKQSTGLHEHAGLLDSLIIDSDQLVETTQDKTALAKRYQADAVDMESFAIASFAEQHDLPFVIIRTVIDTLNDDLPSASRFKLGQSSVSCATLLQVIAKPRQWPTLIRTGAQFNEAIMSLKQVADASTDALNFPTKQYRTRPSKL